MDVGQVLGAVALVALAAVAVVALAVDAVSLQGKFSSDILAIQHFKYQSYLDAELCERPESAGGALRRNGNHLLSHHVFERWHTFLK